MEPPTKQISLTRDDKHSAILLLSETEESAVELLHPIRLAGYHTLRAKNAIEALDHIRHGRACLILCQLDRSPLEVTGLCREIRADARSQAIPILLTGPAKARQEYLLVGADEYLEWPGDDLKLVATIARYYERSQNAHVLHWANDELMEKVEERTLDLVKANYALRQEIEQREEATAALRESEDRYRRFLENSPDAILVHFADEIVFANRAALKLSGATDEADLAGKSPRHLVHPDSLDFAKQKIREVLRQGREVTHAEGKFLTLDGRVIDVDVCVKPFVYAGKRCLQTTLRDISERQHREDLVKNSLAREQKRRRNRLTIDLAILSALLLTFLALHFGRVFDLVSQRLSRTNRFEPHEGVIFALAVFVIIALVAFYLRRWYEHRQEISQRKQFEATLRNLQESLEDRVRERTAELANANQALFEDIQTRKVIEEALRTSEERCKLVLEAGKIDTWDWDLRTNELFLSENLRQKAGFEPTLESFLNSIHPDDRDMVSEAIRRSLEEGHPYELEFRTIRRDKSVEWVMAKGKTLHDANGAAYRMLGSSLDITDRKQTESALAASDARFKLIARATTDVIWDWELSTGKVWWNENVSTLFGYPMAQAGDAVWWYEHIHPEDLERTISNVDAAIENNWKNYSGEYRFQRSDGSYAYILERGYVLGDGKGNPVRIIASMMDISERKEFQLQLQRQLDFTNAITTSLGEGLYALDGDGRVTFINRAAEEMLGWDLDELAGRKIHDVIHFQNADGTPNPAASCRLSEVLQSGKAIQVATDSYTRRDGSIFSVSYTSSPISTAGETSGAVVAFHDITKQQALEAQLRHVQKLESIGQLAAGIAHEINTPVQYVGDNVRFIQDALKDSTRVLEKYAELAEACRQQSVTNGFLAEVETIVAEADVDYLLQEMPVAIQQALEGIQRIAKIVQSMKDFAHPGSAEKQAVDLNRAIESTITVARNEWKYVAELNTAFDERLPPVPCLLGEFNQVILNVIINAAHAIDAANQGSNNKGTISVSTAKAGEWAEVRISDTGNGIPATIRSRIFDPFFTTKEVGKGTGQGLAISHAVVVEKHGGEIDFESEEGHGTTFIIRLPLREHRAEA